MEVRVDYLKGRVLKVRLGLGRLDSGDYVPHAQKSYRDHAIVEQTIADAAASALAHLPSGSFKRQRGLGAAVGNLAQPHPPGPGLPADRHRQQVNPPGQGDQTGP